jgi:hypothetical protein
MFSFEGINVRFTGGDPSLVRGTVRIKSVATQPTQRRPRSVFVMGNSLSSLPLAEISSCAVPCSHFPPLTCVANWQMFALHGADNAELGCFAGIHAIQIDNICSRNGSPLTHCNLFVFSGCDPKQHVEC